MKKELAIRLLFAMTVAGGGTAFRSDNGNSPGHVCVPNSAALQVPNPETEAPGQVENYRLFTLDSEHNLLQKIGSMIDSDNEGLSVPGTAAIVRDRFEAFDGSRGKIVIFTNRDYIDGKRFTGSLTQVLDKEYPIEITGIETRRAGDVIGCLDESLQDREIIQVGFDLDSPFFGIDSEINAIGSFNPLILKLEVMDSLGQVDPSTSRVLKLSAPLFH